MVGPGSWVVGGWGHLLLESLEVLGAGAVHRVVVLDLLLLHVHHGEAPVRVVQVHGEEDLQIPHAHSGAAASAMNLPCRAMRSRASKETLSNT